MRKANPVASALTPAELEAAGRTPVWVVWWEEPERSWEAVCLSEAEAEKEYAARSGDSLLAQWGKVGRQGAQSLLQWYENHAPIEGCVKAVRAVLEKTKAGAGGPVVVRTW